MLSRYFDMASHYTAACKVSHSRKVKKKKTAKSSDRGSVYSSNYGRKNQLSEKHTHERIKRESQLTDLGQLM